MTLSISLLSCTAIPSACPGAPLCDFLQAQMGAMLALYRHTAFSYARDHNGQVGSSALYAAHHSAEFEVTWKDA